MCCLSEWQPLLLWESVGMRHSFAPNFQHLDGCRRSFCLLNFTKVYHFIQILLGHILNIKWCILADFYPDCPPGSGNGWVLSDNKPLPEPMLHSHDAITRSQRVKFVSALIHCPSHLCLLCFPFSLKSSNTKTRKISEAHITWSLNRTVQLLKSEMGYYQQQTHNWTLHTLYYYCICMVVHSDLDYGTSHIVYNYVKGQSHKMCLTSYRFTSLLFHVKQPSYSCDTAFLTFDLENPRSRS